MVESAEKSTLKPSQLAARMVIYAASFLASILVVLPFLFHRLGVWTGLQAWFDESVGAGDPWARRIVGGLLFLVFLAGYLVSSMWLVIVGKGPFVEFDPPREFVASGPYRWMRNPVAACLVLTVAGEAVFFASAGIALLAIVGIPVAHLQVTLVEEPRLRSRFGVSYEDYCRRVNRWLPRPPKF